MKLNDADFLKAELDMGIGFHNPGFIELAEGTVRQITDIPYQTVLDYGAGTGVYADAFSRAGKKVATFDISPAHREYIKKEAPHLTIAKKPITTDLLVWIEVAEHMTDDEIDKLLGSISPRFVLFSSTSGKTEWDEQWGHINIKDQQEWIALFEKYGYRLNRELGAPTPYSKLFEKKQPTE